MKLLILPSKPTALPFCINRTLIIWFLLSSLCILPLHLIVLFVCVCVGIAEPTGIHHLRTSTYTNPHLRVRAKRTIQSVQSVCFHVLCVINLEQYLFVVLIPTTPPLSLLCRNDFICTYSHQRELMEHKWVGKYMASNWLILQCLSWKDSKYIQWYF